MRIDKGRNATGRIVDETLKVVLFAGVAGLIVVAPNSFTAIDMLVLKKLGKNKAKEAARIRTHLKRLNLIQVSDNFDGTYTIELTKKGKKRSIQASLETINLVEKGTWDGKWRIVMFDIPEKYKKHRDFLSYQLKSKGFMQLQKSVFVFPYPADEFLALVKEAVPEVGPFVLALEASEISNHNQLVKQFSNIL